ncbi:hypothetical protein GH714_003191 [Hevea brasiliensis]|uniref:Retrotransposon gag domain-containing protein n=1 Tax=Hevea brasiliensis TaxID=3981 RepID=A0A6A6NC18_HEVBR|nr:hypothetical protein GH714_003191 [Hevea brasiliensis]
MADQGDQEQAVGASVVEEQTGHGRRKGQTRPRDPSPARDEMGEVEARLDRIESHLVTGDDKFDDLNTRLMELGEGLDDACTELQAAINVTIDRSKLRRLTQGGAIRDYVKEFSEVLLEVPEYPDQELLFFFKDGLQSWVKLEIERRGAPNLAAAITIAESLVEYKRNDKGKNKDGKHKNGGEKGGGKEGSKDGSKEGNGGKKPWTGKKNHWGKKFGKSGNHDNTTERGPLRCYNCQGPHLARDCPKMGPWMRGLLKMRTLLHTGWLKAVNSAPIPAHGVANNVAVKIGEWTGSINFSIVAMDDYACVLGMDFMDKVRAIPIPFANSLCIVENGSTSMVPLKRKVGGSILSAMQLAKGVKKCDPTFLVALSAEEIKLAMEVPSAVQVC